MRWVRRIVLVSCLILAGVVTATGGTEYSHQKYFEHYEGTATCLKCHKSAARAFHASQHYQWRGQTPQLVNSRGELMGKMNMINDFCTNPQPNWIGQVVNHEGKVVGKGCSGCHAGFGKLPTAEASEEQLLNIDCLICHASGYRRDLYETDEGGWEWRPILWKNQEGMDSVAKRISKPTRTMCLRCHSASGGGPNYKRGDLEYALRDCEPSFDVHMASEGADLHCADCHAGKDHRVRGRGADLAATDMPDEHLSCDNGECHDSEPHSQQLLNTHARRVDCTVCHIPEFAKEDPTDMRRDWSDTHFSEEKGKYVYAVETRANVVPSYAWFNGTTWALLPGEAARRNDDGVVLMNQPQGSKDDPEARIHAFKLHHARMPFLEDKGWILPITTEEFYAHGDIERAVREGAEMMFGIEDAEFEWAETQRWMGLYHEVVPARDALRCLDCHGPNGRLDWKALGYAGDPLAQCLGSE